MAGAALPRLGTPLNSSCQPEKVSANRTRSNRCQDGSSTTPERQPPQPQTTLPSAADGASHCWGRPIGCRSTEKSSYANLGVFSNLRYQHRSSAGDAAAAACSQLRACPQMTVAATGPFVQVGTVFPRSRVGPTSLDRRRIGCSATPAGVEPQGGHATDQTSHGCMMKPIGAASSAACLAKQRIGIAVTLHMNE